MKHRLLAAALTIGLAIGAYGELPLKPLNLPAGAHHPVLSPDGTTLLYSTDTHDGLKAMNMATGETSLIDAGAAAGFNPVFTTDSRTVYYRTAEMKDNLLYRDVRSYSFDTRNMHKVSPMSRDKVDMAAFRGGNYAVDDYNTIRVSLDGKEVSVNPIADSHSYLWASLSADNKQLLFSEPFKGVFIADADGSNARRLLRKGDNPTWAGEHTIVAIITHDDGYVVLDSRLVAVDTRSGEITYLTPEDMLVGEATAAGDGTVVVADVTGNMFIFNLND